MFPGYCGHLFQTFLALAKSGTLSKGITPDVRGPPAMHILELTIVESVHVYALNIQSGLVPKQGHRIMIGQLSHFFSTRVDQKSMS
jgi:hypothetical protein